MLRLRELREAKRINQQKLAIALNVTQAAISKYELGLSEPDISMLKNIADYFNVSIDYLTGFSDCPLPISGADFSENEAFLISNYRRLDLIKKEKAQAYIQGLLQE